jgi:hypothetical protein
MNAMLRTLILVITTTVLAAAVTAFSSVTGPQLNGNLQIADLTSVVITNEDIHNLPPGESRLTIEAGSPAAAKPPSGQVVFTVDGVSRSVPLTKVGTGTLTFPSASSLGVTKVGAGTLANTPTPSSRGITKLGSQRLILQSAGSHVVYEFRDLGIAELDSVFFQNTARIEKIRLAVQQNRSPAAIKGWPFKRLLIGPAQGIAQVEGWKSSKPPVKKYICSGGSCACSGTSDCLSLASSCSSTMNCDGAGNGIKCYCKSN